MEVIFSEIYQPNKVCKSYQVCVEVNLSGIFHHKYINSFKKFKMSLRLSTNDIRGVWKSNLVKSTNLIKYANFLKVSNCLVTVQK